MTYYQMTRKKVYMISMAKGAWMEILVVDSLGAPARMEDFTLEMLMIYSEAFSVRVIYSIYFKTTHFSVVVEAVKGEILILSV